MGWVTIFGRVNHLSISPSDPGQLSPLSSAGSGTGNEYQIKCGDGLRLGIFVSACGRVYD